MSETQRYLHLFAVFFDKNLVKYIFGIFNNSEFQILLTGIIILEFVNAPISGIFSGKDQFYPKNKINNILTKSAAICIYLVSQLKHPLIWF